MRRAFTLVEMLSILAIILVIAGMLFPVLRSVQDQGNRASCLSNFRQVHLATQMYVSDYDDRFMPANQQPAELTSKADRTWVQLVLPYVRSFEIFKCPADYGLRPKPEATFEADLVPGDTTSIYYTASMRTNIGYNYLYLAPVVRSGDEWGVETRFASGISKPSETLMFVDTVWQRDQHGNPSGGGSFLVIPPCRWESLNGGRRDSFFQTQGSIEREVMVARKGWAVNERTSSYVYGGAWPWHRNNINVIHVDGNARSLSPKRLSAGCDVQDNWDGYINDLASYVWDFDGP